MKKLFPSYVRVPLIFFTAFFAMEYFVDSGDRPAFLAFPMVSVFLFVFLFLLIAIEITVKAIDKITFLLLTEEQRKQKEIEENTSFFESKFYTNLVQKLTATEPIEKEGDLLLDHDYDGIKELDNNLPPWWVYMFYMTIIFAVIYMANYHFFGDDNQTAEFEKEMKEAKLAVEEYKKTAKDLIDANSVVLLTEAGDLAAGKKVFESNCVACHRNDGGGGIGPNLTDGNWILGGGIKNVFNTITEGGRDGKGMVSWKGTLKPSEIQLVASYVLSLKGSNPAGGKAPEGDVWAEAPAAK